MSIVTLLVILILVGVGLYLVNSVIPMDKKIKTVLNVVVILLVLLWLVDVFFSVGPTVGHAGHIKLC